MHAGTYRGAAAVTAVVALGLVGLSGCGSGGGGTAGAHRGSAGTSADGGTATSFAPAPPPSPFTPAPIRKPTATQRQTPAPAKAAPPAAGGADSNSRACFDGTCRISVSKPTDIPVDSRFGFSTFAITHIGADGVTVEAEGGGTHLRSGVSPGGTASLNGLSIRVRSVSGHTARLSISPSN
jgi:hypothetical protein